MQVSSTFSVLAASLAVVFGGDWTHPSLGPALPARCFREVELRNANTARHRYSRDHGGSYARASRAARMGHRARGAHHVRGSHHALEPRAISLRGFPASRLWRLLSRRSSLFRAADHKSALRHDPNGLRPASRAERPPRSDNPSISRFEMEARHPTGPNPRMLEVRGRLTGPDDRVRDRTAADAGEASRYRPVGTQNYRFLRRLSRSRRTRYRRTLG